MRDVASGTNVGVTLPVLNTSTPWQIRAPGACLFAYGTGG